MSRRKQELSDKLSGEQPRRLGWQDTIMLGREEPPDEEPYAEEPAAPARSPRGRRQQRKSSARAGRYRRKTYLMTDELIEQIAYVAEHERVGINDLVRFLLGVSLDMIEHGELEIPTQPARRRIDSG